MNSRDQEYVENRLIAPATEATEAITRLRRAGEHQAAEKVMAALQEFTDVCRAVRHELFYQAPKR